MPEWYGLTNGEISMVVPGGLLGAPLGEQVDSEAVPTHGLHHLRKGALVGQARLAPDLPVAVSEADVAHAERQDEAEELPAEVEEL